MSEHNIEKVWNIKKVEKIPEIILERVQDKVLASLLAEREINTKQKIDDFLNPEIMGITSPYVFCDMEKSVQRVISAIEKGENIVIWGDFDADGVTSTAILYNTLKKIGAKVDYYIPNRKDENHGFNAKALIKLISQKRAKVIISVDCGTSNIEEIKLAKGLGVDIIVTDHHESGSELPDAFAIINPKAQNALQEDLTAYNIENLSQLAGCGVAFKLACALLDKKQEQEFAKELLALVAVGTVADVVPLLGENRYFVKAGLEEIQKGKHFGIKKLLEACGYEGNSYTSENIAFGVAPRINASGRLATAEVAFKVLVSEDKNEILKNIETLNRLNKERQELCENTFNEAISMLNTSENSSIIALYNNSWHIGVIGIVASKLVETFNKPVFLMTSDEKNPEMIRCSARSIPEVNLYEVIDANGELLEGYGGHTLAAGLTFDSTKTSFDTLKEVLNATVKDVLEDKIPKPKLDIDFELEPEDLNLEFLKKLEILEPFGEKNPNPVFCLKNLYFQGFRTIGANGNHLKITCEDESKKTWECLWWNKSEIDLPLKSSLEVAFYPRTNTFNNETIIQLSIQDIKSEYLKPEKTKHETKTEIKVYDHRKKLDILPQINDFAGQNGIELMLFAENKELVARLERFENLRAKIFNRFTPRKANHIMFFDYPPNKKIMHEIIKTSEPLAVHFMGMKSLCIEPLETLKNLSAMLKYSHNHKNGEFLIENVLLISGLDIEAVETALKLFLDIKMIDIVSRTGNLLKIEFLKSVEISRIKESLYFEEFTKNIENTTEFRKNIEKSTLKELDILVKM